MPSAATPQPRASEQRGVAPRLTSALAWALVLVGVVAGAAPLPPPRPVADPGAREFSVDRAFDHVERIAVAPRPIGSPASERARQEIGDQLTALGLEPRYQELETPDYFGAAGATVSVVNVMARIPGQASTGAVALVGHYDTVPGVPGANDDASAIAVQLEVARAVLARTALRNDVLLLFTDGEEPAPRFGSTAFVAGHPWFDDVAFVINLETIGSAGPSLLVDESGHGRWVIDRYADAVPYPAAFSFLTATNQLLGGSNTDFAPFRDAGVAGVDIAYLHGSSIYHTARDTPEAVGLGSLQQHGSNALALVTVLGDVDLTASPAGASATDFFTVARFAVVRYPASATLVVVLLAGVLLAAGGWLGRDRRGGLLALGTTTLVVLAAQAAATGAWTVLAGRRGDMSVAESYVYLGGLLALTAGIGTLGARLARRRTGAGPDPAGVVALWWLLAAFTVAVAPGLGYLFAWPALAGGLALLWLRLRPGGAAAQLGRLVLAAWTASVVLVPAIDITFQLAQPRPGNLDSQILAVVAVPVLFAALIVELIRAFWPSSAPGPP